MSRTDSRSPTPGTTLEHYDLHRRNPYRDRFTTLNFGPDGPFRMVSLAIPAGKALGDHRAPSPACLVMIEGRGLFFSGNTRIELTPGTVVDVPADQTHRIEALDDCHFVLVR
ncbi:MAG: hypothetical protein R3E68_01550 [Burkholderiaceae bacterium]